MTEMKDIPNFEGKYAATKDGRIWSYKHKKFLKPKIVKGYCHVDLVNKENKICQFLVHRLIGMTFLPNPDNLPCINHKDECKTNNHVDNLEWCSYVYNVNYGTRNARSKKSKASNGSMKKCWEASVVARKKKVRCIELDTIYDSLTEAAKSLNINMGHISDCCRGNRNVCGGYHWEYVTG